MDSWTEIKIEIDAENIDLASDIAHMTVPYGIYIEDYRTLEEEAMEIAHIDLIDEDLLAKDRSKGYVHIYLEPEMNPAEAIAFLTERYAAAGIRFDVETLVCKREDWQNNWKKYFKPITIGNKLLIQPSWEEECHADGRCVLRIEPGLAFGTGSHDTTRLCLECLEEYMHKGDSVLDLGCGSGILALSAIQLGASKAVGVDIDEIAVKTAIENAKLNDIYDSRYEFHCGDMAEKITEKYDIVVSNIVADVIISFCKDAKKFMKEKSVFIVSGIIDTREDDVLKAFKENGFTILERRSSNGWLCFVLA